jgi:hypothetical protein
MRRPIAIAATVLAAFWICDASAEDQSLLKQCWTPQALAGTDQEAKSSRPRFRLDILALKQVSLPSALHPFVAGEEGS